MKLQGEKEVNLGSITGPQQLVDLVFNQLIPDSSAQRLPDDLIVFEIVRRLPLKKVLQCMCVSKTWCSIIHHPKFAKAYRNCKPCCLVSIHDPDKRPDYHHIAFHPRHFCYSPLKASRPPERFTNLFEVVLPGTISCCGGVTQVDNGLFCYYSRHHLFISNVFTGETMKLPEPPKLPSTSSFTLHKYCVGYDAVNRVYKLLSWGHFISDRSTQQTSKFDILTLGNNSSWREVADSERCVWGSVMDQDRARGTKYYTNSTFFQS